jgi:hypothetical protein
MLAAASGAAAAAQAASSQPATTQAALAANAPKIVITPQQVRELFGQREAKMVLLVPSGQAQRIALPGPKKSGQLADVLMVDLSAASPAFVRVADDAVTSMSDPFISPDGTRVVYASKDKELIVRRLDGSDRTVVAKASTGFDARWWVHPRTKDEYLIYGDTLWENGEEFDGKTLIQKIKKGDCAPDGPVKVLLDKYRLCGGRTPSGKYICTTLPGFVLAEFADPLAVENAQVKLLVDGPKKNPAKCNGSICPDDSGGPKWIWEEKSHQNVQYGTSDEDMNSYPNPKTCGYEGTHTVQLCEWSTDGDFLTAIWSSGPRDTVKLPMRPFIFKVSASKWVQVADAGDAQHLWVQP